MSAIIKLSSQSHLFAVRLYSWIREIVGNSHVSTSLHTKHMGPKEVSRRIIPEIASGLKCLPIWLILLSTVYFLFGPAFTIPSNMVLRPYGPPRPFYASLTAPPLEHLGCALSHLCHMVLGKFSIQNIWEWTHVHHRRQHISRCPPMRCVALQAGLPIVRGGLYAPWGQSHVLIRLAAAGPDPSHGPSPPDP